MPMLTAKAVAEKLGIGRSTVWYLMREDATFPRPTRLSLRTVRWEEEDVNKWLQSKKERCVDEAV